MSMLVNSFSVSGGGGAKTYADFQAHLVVIATTGIGRWDDQLAVAPSSTGIPGSYRVTCGPHADLGMVGSPWATYMRNTAISTRIVQHCLPSEAEFLAHIAAGREVFVRLVDGGGTQICPAVNRNGYLSTLGNGAAQIVDLFLYWDGTQAQQMNPQAGTGPTPYTW